jgi:hypothetical protein
MTDAKTIDIVNGKRLRVRDILEEEWGGTFVQEANLVIAAGELRSMRDGEVLYNTVLQERVASICGPLDGGLQPDFLGVIAVSGDLSASDIRDVCRNIADGPRGTWAILVRPDGRCDLWMSNGIGGVRTPSGEKFTLTRKPTENDGFLSLYGEVLSTLIQERRSAIRNEIVDASVAAAAIPVGTRRKGTFHVGDRSWSTLTYDGVAQGHYVGGGDAYRLIMSKPGKRSAFVVESDRFMSLLGIEPIMPEAYAEAGATHEASLPEMRRSAADAAWPIEAERVGLDPRDGMYVHWADEGSCILERRILGGPAQGVTCRIGFQAGSNTIRSIRTFVPAMAS